jgi:hypothetical protein
VLVDYETPAITNTAATNVTGATADVAGILDATNSVFTVVAYYSTSNHATAAAWLADGNPLCTATGTQTNFAIASDGASGAFGAWNDLRSGTPTVYVQRITGFIGRGHSCSLHTTRDDRIRELGEQARVSRIMVRQSQCYGNSGDYINGMPFSLTLGCGTWGGNIASENITWKHFINTTWVSLPIEPVIPKEETLFGDHWAKYGK